MIWIHSSLQLKVETKNNDPRRVCLFFLIRQQFFVGFNFLRKLGVRFLSPKLKISDIFSNGHLVLGDKEWTPHDLRQTGAPMMQKLKVHRDVINLCQTHVIGTKVDRVYLLDEYAEERREAWQQLGNWLDVTLGVNTA